MEVKKGLYRLRNGIVVETGRDDAIWTADVYVISNPSDEKEGIWQPGAHCCLLFSEWGSRHDPLTWKGGHFGDAYDIVEMIDIIEQ